MRPERVPIKGPVGKDDEGDFEVPMPEAQETYETDGMRVDFTGVSDPVQDPTELRAHEEDHTPNFTKLARQSKPAYGRYEGRGSGGVGL